MGPDYDTRTPQTASPGQTPSAGVPGRGVTVIRGRDTEVVPGRQEQQQQQQQQQQPAGSCGPDGPTADQRVSALATMTALARRIDGAYENLFGQLELTYEPFSQAYQAMTGSLQRLAEMRAMLRQIALDLVCVGFAGVFGGIAQAVLRGTSSHVLVGGIATGGGDIVKYITRLANLQDRAPAAAPTQGLPPDRWLHAMSGGIRVERGGVNEAIADLIDATNQNCTVPTPQQLDVINQYLAAIRSATAQPQAPVYYSRGLWRGWLEAKLRPITNRVSLTAFMQSHEAEFRLLRAQCGEAEGQRMIDEMSCASAMGPANRDAGNRPLDGLGYATCGPSRD